MDDVPTNIKTPGVSHLASLDPIVQFRNWLDEASRLDTNMYSTHTMSLATAGRTGVPSVRVVLMKHFDHEGFRFITNRQTLKATHLAENSNCSLMFYWPCTKKSVRIEGVAREMSREESLPYFYARPRISQITVWTGYQSQVIPNRQVFEDRYEELDAKFADLEVIPCPDTWLGYIVKPRAVEFWQQGGNRREDQRVRFRLPHQGGEIDMTICHPAANGWVYGIIG